MAGHRAVNIGFVVVALAGLAAVVWFGTRQLVVLLDLGDHRSATRLAGGTVGGPFALVDHTGRPVTDRDYRGRLLLVYFGYTYCPDVCPTDLYVIGQALERLGSDAAQVQPLFVTIDPARDTQAHLAGYVPLFHPALVGLTGTPGQIAAAATAYKVYYARVEAADAATNDYLMDHSALTYLMDRDGRFIEALPHGSTPEAIAGAVRAALESP